MADKKLGSFPPKPITTTATKKQFSVLHAMVYQAEHYNKFGTRLIFCNSKQILMGFIFPLLQKTKYLLFVPIFVVQFALKIEQEEVMPLYHTRCIYVQFIIKYLVLTYNLFFILIFIQYFLRCIIIKYIYTFLINSFVDIGTRDIPTKH